MKNVKNRSKFQEKMAVFCHYHAMNGKVLPDICHFFTLAKFLENKIYTEKLKFFALNM